MGAVLRGEMTRERWLMGLFTYLVPYTVSIHGQYSTRSRHRINLPAENPTVGVSENPFDASSAIEQHILIG